jgi:membrane-bound lytic murein transglycosylase D
MHGAFDAQAVMLPVLGASYGAANKRFWHSCGDCALSWDSSIRSEPAAAATPEAPGDIWSSIRGGLELAQIRHPRIDSQLERYRRFPSGLAKASERSAPFLGYVSEQVADRGMPADLALLPFVESAYRATAVSSVGAKGLWQLMPPTAERFGLMEDWWFDPRLDLESATRAALDYLEFLHAKFDGDWLLALAAYNAGEGRVGRAIRSNRKAGRPIDFWHLDLPKETQDYVPRLLAVSRIVNAPDEIGVELLPMPDAPQVDIVAMEGALELIHAAELAGIEVAELKQLNPGLKRSMTHPQGSRALVVPRRVSRHFREALAKLPMDSDSVYRKVEYTVRSGDNLWTIAKRFGVSYKNLAGWNDLDLEGILRPGYKLVVWT